LAPNQHLRTTCSIYSLSTAINNVLHGHRHHVFSIRRTAAVDVPFRSGIGLETTILFAREGAAVLMADISEPALEKALSKVRSILSDSPRVETIKCDVSKESDVEAMVKHLDDWGGVDIMFNNAGIMQ